MSATTAFSPVAELPEVTASVLKNKFSEIARLAAREPVAVSRHKRREFVILTSAQYEEMRESRLAPLAALAVEFDQMVAKMNTPEARRATASLFSASGKALGKAAVKARRAAHA